MRADYLLLTTYCVLRTTYYLLLTTYHLPLTTYYLLLTTGKEASQVRSQYSELVPRTGPDDMAPFAPNATENVIYYKVRGTREMMSPSGG